MEYTRKEVGTLDSQLRVHTAVVAALAKGELEGSALLDEATSLLGFSPPPVIWRNALIDLTGQGVIKRIVINDDDNTVLGVSFQLSENKQVTAGEDDEVPISAP